MSLLTAATLISLEIIFFMLLPWRFDAIRRHSKAMLVIGATILFGVCLFDLIPEMMEIGGTVSLLITGAAWAVFSAVHYLQHQTAEAHGEDAHANDGGLYLLISMALHCFAGGMLLVASDEFSQRLLLHVFWGLALHKGFEAISVSTVILEKAPSRKKLFTGISIYALSFPLGVALTMLVRATATGISTEVIEKIAMVITSAAVGSLLGCLVQDFLVPSFRYVKAQALRKVEV